MQTTEIFVSPTRVGTLTLNGSTLLIGDGTNFKLSDMGKQITIRTSQGDIVRTLENFYTSTTVEVDIVTGISEAGLYYSMDWYSLDLMSNFDYSYNYAIADIREPDRRDSSFSKTITIPGSKNNNNIFGHIFEIDLDGSYNPNLRASVVTYAETIPIFRGNLQLNNIVRNGDLIEYEITVFGDSGNLFNAIGDKLLTDFDMTEFNHNPTEAVQAATWAAPVGAGYVYPIINNGTFNFYTSSLPLIKTTSIYPCLYAKAVVDKIFTGYGFTYTSTFFNTDYFKRLIVPLVGTATRRAIFDFVSPGLEGFFVGISLSSFTVKIMKNTSILAQATWNSSGDFIGNPGDVLTTGEVTLFPGDLVYVTIETYIASGTADVRWLGTGQAYFRASYLDNANQVIVGDFQAQNTITAANSQIPDGFQWTVPFDDDSTLPNFDTGGTYSTVIYQQTVPFCNLGALFTPRIKQRDFLVGLIRMFNLYMAPDPYTDKNLIIEPRDDFYAAGTIVDWTDKLDTGKDIDITPMGDLNFRDFKWTYKPDEDFFNKDYKDKYTEVYGDKKLIVQTDFQTTSQVIETTFSATPLTDSLNNDLIIPTIIKANDGTIPDTMNGNIRIMRYNGMRTGAWKHSFTNHTTYPFAGHVDDPMNPTLDLLFGAPRQTYWTMDDPTLYTNSNLFTTFYQKFIEEITDKDSKIVTAFFHLLPTDIYALDFRNSFLVDGSYFRINKIFAYNPLTITTTKVELLKIKEAVPVSGGVLPPIDFGSRNVPIISPAYSEAIVNPGAALDYSAVDSETFTHQRTLILGSGTPSAMTITLPDNPIVGTQFIINNNAATKSNITIASNTAAIANLYTGSYPTYYVALPNTSITLVYSTGVWQKLPKYDSIGYSEFFDISVDSGFDHTDYYNLFNVSTVNLCVKTATNNLILNITLDPNAPIGSIVNVTLIRATGGTWNSITVNNLEDFGLNPLIPDVGKVINSLSAMRIDGLPTGLWVPIVLERHN